MRHENDRIVVRVTLSANVDLDLERVEADPLWHKLCIGKDTSTREGLENILFEYINQYLIRGPRVMINAPSTNGPSELWPLQMEIISERPSSSVPDASTH